VSFNLNSAIFGGAICLKKQSTILFEDSSGSFIDNYTEGGGATTLVNNSYLTLHVRSTATFISNTATTSGEHCGACVIGYVILPYSTQLDCGTPLDPGTPLNSLQCTLLHSKGTQLPFTTLHSIAKN